MAGFKTHGQCIGCTKCCTSILPLGSKEIQRVKKYIKENNIQPVNRNTIFSNGYQDICPFLNDSGKCNIYAERFEVCRKYECDDKFSLISLDYSDKQMVNLFAEFFPNAYLNSPPDLDEISKYFSASKKKAGF